MSNWFKKKLQQLSDKLNADEEPALPRQSEENNVAVGAQTGRTASLDNVEELKEVTIGAINRAIKMMGYGKSTVSGFAFHSRFADNAIENVAVSALTKDADFVKQIKRTLKSRNIAYKDNLSIEVLNNSALTDKVTPIIDGVGVEVLIPGESLRKIKARVIATEGITWEPEYLLEPSGKTYFIGRCKNPKIDNGPKIHNDIAFIGREEKDEEQYQINNYISRAHAQIVFDKELGAFKIYRSKFLNNPSHKIKIYNAGRNDFLGVSLNQSAVPHVLKDGDSICFNDKVVLEFYLLEG
ncbi:hypothetical protein U0035_00675 [Niabella yanshanensis]|uniref:FHA domain-containing protein n=1 Tax=Niabella yanshanensis TaxID=577386 RepID=A0ABZ0W7L5_9BACT|nr:hypothetical protein [Niabella yanshanensis]WQD38659.1 hypothetical protein U0035_00675 [Niabella yanshanensis]